MSTDPSGAATENLAADELELTLSLRSQLLAEFDGLAHRLERSNAVLQRFAVSAAHDLKAPLANLIGYAELADELLADLGDVADELATVCARIGANATRAMDVVNHLMDYARDTTADIRRQHTDLAEVCDWVVQTLRSRIERSGSNVAIASRLQPVAMHDAAARQLVQNLVGNAIDHRDPSRPLSVVLTVEAEDDDWLVLRVADDGPGIAPERRDEVFALGEGEGSGVGLAACAAVVAEHGGHLWIEDGIQGRGVTIAARLPRPDSDEADIDPATVFVAHPSPDLVAIARLLGRRIGFGVVESVLDPAEAFDRYMSLPERPDVVLVADRFTQDSRVRDGLDVVDEIRAAEPDQSVILVSAEPSSLGDPGDDIEVADVLAAGALEGALRRRFGVEDDQAATAAALSTR